MDCTSPPRRLFLLNSIAAEDVASIEVVVVVEAPAREEEVEEVEVDEEEVRTVAWFSGIVWVLIILFGLMDGNK